MCFGQDLVLSPQSRIKNYSPEYIRPGIKHPTSLKYYLCR